jgi:hypothetical protein
LGRLEEGNVSEAFSQMSARSAELVAARRKGCEALAARFEAPLKEAVSVEAVVQNSYNRTLCMLRKEQAIRVVLKNSCMAVDLCVCFMMVHVPQLLLLPLALHLQVRSVRAVTAVCNDRAVALATHMAAKHEVDAKKVRLLLLLLLQVCVV